LERGKTGKGREGRKNCEEGSLAERVSSIGLSELPREKKREVIGKIKMSRSKGK